MIHELPDKPHRLLLGVVIFAFAGFLLCATAMAGPGPDPEGQARQILKATGIKGGLIVHLGCGDGRLTAALHAGDSYIVHGLDTDAANVESARKHAKSQQLYGVVSIERLRGDRLPYVDNMVNLLVSEDLGRISMNEVMRVLVPNGVAYVKQGDRWKKTVKPRPKEIDEWTHYLHDPGNNAVAHDSVVGPPAHYQWVGSPKWSRHHDHMASTSALVSANGRAFYILDEGPRWSILMPSSWALIARDAFNGTILWKRRIPSWHTQLWPLKSGPAQLPRRLVAIGDVVYVTLGLQAPVSALDAATGKTIRTYDGTAATEEIVYCDGVLYVLADDPRKPEDVRPSSEQTKQVGRDWRWDERERRVMAVQADTGRVLWNRKQRVAPLALAAAGERVLLHDGEKVVCLNARTGRQNWASEPIPRWDSIPSYFGPTLVVYKDVVLFAGGEKMVPHRGGEDTMTALSVETGKTLWKSPHPPGGYQSPEDVLVAGGLVWSGATTNGRYSGVFSGRDPATGELKNEFPPDVETHWFHHRCHRAKATDRYLLVSRTGIEFLDINKNHWICHHWVRGGCLYGIMPCNGLIYAPPHNCACYIVAKLYGFSALAAESPSRKLPAVVSDEDRLERGPAYGRVDARAAGVGPGDWPTYRHDASRSACTTAEVSPNLGSAWKIDLGGRLSSPVVAGGKLFVASVDTHTVHAFAADTGKEAWSFTCGGRVDSPPTIFGGCVFFGSADGRVYCLRAADGELVWSFRAALIDRRMMAFEQVESVWPVHGSVLVRDGVVYCAAGRSMFLDGGLRLLRLEAATGKKLSETLLDDRDPESGDNLQVKIQGLNMPVALPDILSSDGRYVYMRSQMFDLEGKRVNVVTPKDAADQKGDGAHLFSPTGFLDDAWFHRSYWIYGKTPLSGAGGYYRAGRYAPAGRMLAFSDSSVYGYGRKAHYFRWTTPIEYQLFSIPRVDYRVDRLGGGGSCCVRVAKSESLNPAGKPLTVEAWVKAGKADGVVAARGGPAHGYALLLKGGRPQFAVRVKSQICCVNAEAKTIGKWVHLAGVLTPDKKLRIYVNGKLSGEGEASGLIAAEPHQAMEIGSDEGGGVGDYQSPFGLTGLVDEVRVYHRALDAKEVSAHASPKRRPRVDAEGAGLVLYFSFDAGNAHDDSGLKNEGKIDGPKVADGRFGKAMQFIARKKPRGVSGRPETKLGYHWLAEAPILVRAMAIAGDTLFLAGPPDTVDEEEVYKLPLDKELESRLQEQVGAFQGEKGGVLWAVSAADGKKMGELSLKSLPTWDGMIAANGRLYITTKVGEVICLTGRE